MFKTIPYRSLFWLILACVTLLALMPWMQEMPKPFRISDKLNHFMAFVVLANFMMAAYSMRYIRAFLLLVLYGASIEAIQYFLPWRSAEWADLGVDAVAIASGLSLFPLLSKLLPGCSERVSD